MSPGESQKAKQQDTYRLQCNRGGEGRGSGEHTPRAPSYTLRLPCPDGRVISKRVTGGVWANRTGAHSFAASRWPRQPRAGPRLYGVAVSYGNRLFIQLFRKCSVFLNDLKDYKAMNEVFMGRFGENPPVRTTIAAAGGIPGDPLVEMDVIANI